MDSHVATLAAPPFRGNEFALRRLEPDGDLELIHEWMNDPEVARFWQKAWPPAQLAEYLEEQHRKSHSTAYVGSLDGVPMSYWELYRADRDPLARYYAARAHDAGIHLLLGPPNYRGRGLAAVLLDVVARWLLDRDERITRVVAEPDAANERSLRAFEVAGFERVALVTLPNKRAALVVRERQPSFDVRNPRSGA